MFHESDEGQVCWFAFEKSEKPGFQYIRHLASDFYVQPGLNNELVIQKDKNDGCLFKDLLDTGNIQHISGKYW